MGQLIDFGGRMAGGDRLRVPTLRELRDASFREALPEDAVDRLLSGDAETGKSLLRDHVNATIGFIGLGGLTHKPPKSLMRMLSRNGNPKHATCSRSSAACRSARACI